MKKKILFNCLLAGVLGVVPVFSTSLMLLNKPTGIRFDGKIFANSESLKKYIDDTYAIKSVESLSDDYYVEKNGKKVYIGQTQMQQIADEASKNSETKTIYSTDSDIQSNLINPNLGELNPQWFAKSEIEPGQSIKIYRGSGDSIYLDEADALTTFINSGNDVYYFNDIYFKDKEELYTYLVNIYFKDEINSNATSLRIKSPNGEYSNIINMNSKSDWKATAAAFIQDNAQTVTRIKTKTGYKYVSSKSDVDNAVNFDDIPYVKVKANQGKQNFVIGLNEADTYDLDGSNFYSGYVNVLDGMANPNNWTRQFDVLVRNNNEKATSLFNKNMNTFFEEFISRGTRQEIRENENDSNSKLIDVKYTSNYLFEPAINARTSLDYVANLGTITSKNQVDGSLVGSSDSVVSLNSDVASIQRQVNTEAISSLSESFASLFTNVYPQYQNIYNEMMEISNNYASMKNFNILLKVPMLFSVAMDRLISAGAPNRLIDATRMYFKNITAIYQNLLELNLGSSALEPVADAQAHGKLDLVSLFGIENENIEFDIQKYQTYLITNYPTLIAATGANNQAILAASLGTNLRSSSLDSVINGIVETIPSLDSVSTSLVHSNTKKSIIFAYNQGNTIMSNKELWEKASDDFALHAALILTASRLTNTSVRDEALDAIQDHAGELLNNPDSWEYVPNDNLFKKYAFYIYETEGKILTPNDILLTINSLETKSLISWISAIQAVEIELEEDYNADLAKRLLDLSPEYGTEYDKDDLVDFNMNQDSIISERFYQYNFTDKVSSINLNSMYNGVYMSFSQFSAVTIMRMLADLSANDTLFIYDEEQKVVVINPEYATAATNLMKQIMDENEQLMIQLTHLYRGFQTIQQGIDDLAIKYKYSETKEWYLDEDTTRNIMKNTAQYSAIINQNIESLQAGLSSINVPLKTGQIIAYSGSATDMRDFRETNNNFELNVDVQKVPFAANSAIISDMSSFVPKIDKSKSAYVIPNANIEDGQITNYSITTSVYLYPTIFIEENALVNPLEYQFDKFIDIAAANDIAIEADESSRWIYLPNVKFKNSSLTLDGTYFFGEQIIFANKWGNVEYQNLTSSSLFEFTDTTYEDHIYSFEAPDVVSLIDDDNEEESVASDKLSSQRDEDLNAENTTKVSTYSNPDPINPNDALNNLMFETTMEDLVNSGYNPQHLDGCLIVYLKDTTNIITQKQGDYVFVLRKSDNSFSLFDKGYFNPADTSPTGGLSLEAMYIKDQSTNSLKQVENFAYISSKRSVDNSLAHDPKIVIISTDANPREISFSSYVHGASDTKSIFGQVNQYIDVKFDKDTGKLKPGETIDAGNEYSRGNGYDYRKIYTDINCGASSRTFDVTDSKNQIANNQNVRALKPLLAINKGTFDNDASIKNKILTNLDVLNLDDDRKEFLVNRGLENSRVDDDYVNTTKELSSDNKKKNKKKFVLKKHIDNEQEKQTKEKTLNLWKRKKENTQSINDADNTKVANVEKRTKKPNIFKKIKDSRTKSIPSVAIVGEVGRTGIDFNANPANEQIDRNEQINRIVNRQVKDQCRVFDFSLNDITPMTTYDFYSEIKYLMMSIDEDNFVDNFRAKFDKFFIHSLIGKSMNLNLTNSEYLSITYTFYEGYRTGRMNNFDDFIKYLGDFGKGNLGYVGVDFILRENQAQQQLISSKTHLWKNAISASNGSNNFVDFVDKFKGKVLSQLLPESDQKSQKAISESLRKWTKDMMDSYGLTNTKDGVKNFNSSLKHYVHDTKVKKLKTSGWEIASYVYFDGHFANFANTNIKNASFAIEHYNYVVDGLNKALVEIEQDNKIDADLKNHKKAVISELLTSANDNLLLYKASYESNTADFNDNDTASSITISEKLEQDLSRSETIRTQMQEDLNETSDKVRTMNEDAKKIDNQKEKILPTDINLDDVKDNFNAASRSANEIKLKKSTRIWNSIKTGLGSAMRIGGLALQVFGNAMTIVTFAMIIVDIYFMMQEKPCYYSFKVDNYEWQWNGGTYTQAYDSTSKVVVDARTASSMNLNDPIQLNHTYIRDSYYYEGKLYEDSINGRNELLNDYVDNLVNGSSTSNASKTLYTFEDFNGILDSSNNIDNELGLYNSKSNLASAVIEDIDQKNEESKYVSQEMRSFTDNYGGVWNSTNDIAAIEAAAKSIKTKIRPTIVSLRPILDENGYLKTRRNYTGVLPGTSYDAASNKLVTEVDKQAIDSSFSTNGWFIVNDSANLLNDDGKFVQPLEKTAITTAKNNLLETTNNIYKNSIINLTTYNTRSLPILNSTFSEIEDVVYSGIKEQKVIVYNSNDGVKYFVATSGSQTRSSTSAYSNFLRYVMQERDIKLSVKTNEVITHYEYNGIMFYSFDTLLKYVNL